VVLEEMDNTTQTTSETGMGCTPPRNQNNYIYQITYFPPLNGGEQENKPTLNGGNMNNLLQRYHDYLCGEHSRKNTIDNKLTAMRILLRQTRGDINSESIQQFKTWANQHYSHNSRNNRINAWNQCLRWIGHPELQMKHIGFIETNQYALNEEEIDLLIHASMNNPLEHLILLCLFDGALRPSEIINIQLDLRDGNKLYLDDTKTGDKRIILSPALQQSWENYQRIRPQPQPGNEQYLILKDHYKQQGTKYNSTDPLIDLIQKLGEAAGLIKEITPYTIRRTSATLRQNKYSKYYMGDDKLVQMLFRHKDIKTTKRYDRTTDTDIERYFDDLSKQDKSIETDVNRQTRDINLIYSPQDLILYQEDDNTSLSFSYSLISDSFFIRNSNNQRAGGDDSLLTVFSFLLKYTPHFSVPPESPWLFKLESIFNGDEIK
jgi:integrase